MSGQSQTIPRILSGLIVMGAAMAFGSEAVVDSADDDRSVIEEIIIEGERATSLPLKDTSHTIVVFTEDDLERGTDRGMQDIYQRVPNVATNPFNGAVIIRGVATNGILNRGFSAGSVTTLRFADRRGLEGGSSGFAASVGGGAGWGAGLCAAVAVTLIVPVLSQNLADEGILLQVAEIRGIEPTKADKPVVAQLRPLGRRRGVQLGQLKTQQIVTRAAFETRGQPSFRQPPQPCRHTIEVALENLGMLAEHNAFASLAQSGDLHGIHQ